MFGKINPAILVLSLVILLQFCLLMRAQDEAAEGRDLQRGIAYCEQSPYPLEGCVDALLDRMIERYP